MREGEAYNNNSNVLFQARHLCWSMSVKSSIVRCLSNAVVKVPRNCWERTLNIVVIKYFRNETFEKNYQNSDRNSSHPIVVSYRCFKTKNINENTEYHGTFILFKRYLYHGTIVPCLYSKQGSPIFLLFGSWCVGLSQSFFDKSNLIIWVDIQRLHENGKWILRVFNGFYILFKWSFRAVAHCFIKLFHLCMYLFIKSLFTVGT